MMKEEYVKITGSGKVRLHIRGHMKATMKGMLELFIADSDHRNGLRKRFDATTCGELINVALMNEIYNKHFTQLSFVHGDAKLLLTFSQAYAFWHMCQQYDSNSFLSSNMGGLLLQLHQKLS